MGELIKADGLACLTCAAMTFTQEGKICQPWKLGPSNKNKKSIIRTTHHTKGTTLRPEKCPHPESVVSTTASALVVLRKKFKK